MVLNIAQRGFIEELGERVRIRREGGYCGFDILLFLLFFFGARMGVGLKTFWLRARPYGKRLAALGERRSLASSASVSRALDKVDSERTQRIASWLLYDVAGIEEVLRHPAVQTIDTNGEGWHVFDFDPTVTTLRHRALPTGGDLPEALRRSEDTAAIGYSGRKRGDVQFRRATLQHSGSGTWLYARLFPGNGRRRVELRGALDAVQETCKRLTHPLDRTLLRGDGEYGGVPELTACREARVPVLTRLTRPKLFERDDIRLRLAEATWEYVPDAMSGPRRSATELGTVTLNPAKTTVRDDGTPYAPVEVRVVVSRFRNEEGKPSRGQLIDGWQYELFVADVDPVAWPAPECVALYFGRAAEENRFAQEDRELVLDRIFSYHLPGQELATIIGLMTWNLAIARGFELETPPGDTPTTKSRDIEVDPRPGPDLSLEQEHPVKPSLVTPESIRPETPEEETSEAPVHKSLDDAEANLVKALSLFPWDAMLKRRPGWHWTSDGRGLVCPDNKALVLTCITTPKGQQLRSRLNFRLSSGACSECPTYPGCTPLTHPKAIKQASFTVDTDRTSTLRSLLTTAQNLRVPRPTAPKRNTRKSSSDSSARLLIPPDPTLLKGPWAAVSSLFLPAAARSLFRHIVQDATIILTVGPHLEVVPQPRLLARSDADRQHRRNTWRQHFQRYALAPGTPTQLTLHGPNSLARIVTAGGKPACLAGAA